MAFYVLRDNAISLTAVLKVPWSLAALLADIASSKKRCFDYHLDL